MGSLGLVVIWLLQTFFFFPFSQTADTQSPQSSHIRARKDACTRACVHTRMHTCEQTDRLYLQYTQHQRVCKAEKCHVSYLMEVQTEAKV